MSAFVPSLQHLQDHREDLVVLCRRRHVRRLDLSGSTARGEAGAGSDYDFLVEFEPLPPGATQTLISA
jgi:predicted nucleotidyltransferase